MAPLAVWDCLMPSGLSRLAGAADGGARAERAEGRSVARSGAGKGRPAERSAAGCLMR